LKKAAVDDNETLLLHSLAQAEQENIQFSASVLVFHTVRPILVLEASYSCNAKVTFAYLVVNASVKQQDHSVRSRLFSAGADEQQLILFHTGHSTSSGGGACTKQGVSSFQDF